MRSGKQRNHKHIDCVDLNGEQRGGGGRGEKMGEEEEIEERGGGEERGIISFLTLS